MRVSVLLAFRDGPPTGHRTRLWAFLRERWAEWFPDLEVVVGTDDGDDPFHKTLALNRAAAQATGDVFVLTDADTWVPSAQLRTALEGIRADPNTWWRPWTQKLKVGQADTETILEATTWDGRLPVGADHVRRLENRNAYWAAPPHVFTRAQFDLVGRMDLRFRGWGQEDEALSMALRQLVGRPQRLDGWAIHLWHPRLGRSGADRWSDADAGNVRYADEYRRARNPRAMAELIRTRESV